ncbi:TPA: hypothetical protein ACX3CA_003523 [Vibrio parahaemolyticus]
MPKQKAFDELTSSIQTVLDKVTEKTGNQLTMSSRDLSDFYQSNDDYMLNDDELKLANNYYQSDLAKKELDISAEALSCFPGDLTDYYPKLNELDNEKEELIDKLMVLHEVEDICSAFGVEATKTKTLTDIQTIFKILYANSFSKSELVDVIKFHSSYAGRKCQRAAKQTGMQKVNSALS